MMIRFHSLRKKKKKPQMLLLTLNLLWPPCHLPVLLVDPDSFLQDNIYLFEGKNHHVDTIISEVISAHSVFLIQIQTWYVHIFLFEMGLASDLIHFYLVRNKVKKSPENTSVCCICFRKQTVRVNKTVKSY